MILGVYEDGDAVWIHDYHLMVLPKMLRLQKPRCTIGWFLHIPFPTSEIYKVRVRGSPQHYVYTCYVVHVFASVLLRIYSSTVYLATI